MIQHFYKSQLTLTRSSYICTNKQTHTHHTCVHTHTHTHKHTHAHTHTNAHTHIIHMHACIHMHTHTHARVHTHTHTQIKQFKMQCLKSFHTVLLCIDISYSSAACFPSKCSLLPFFLSPPTLLTPVPATHRLPGKG